MKKLLLSLIFLLKSTHSFSTYQEVSIKDFYAIIEKNEYTNSEGTIRISEINNRINIVFILDNIIYSGDYDLPLKAPINQIISCTLRQQNQEIQVKNVLIEPRSSIKPSFHIWQKDSQNDQELELRFYQRHLELSTRVTLSPEPKTKKIPPAASNFYRDGVPNLSEYYSLTNGKANWRGTRFADIIAQKDNLNFLSNFSTPLDLLSPTFPEAYDSFSLLEKIKFLRALNNKDIEEALRQVLTMTLGFYGFRFEGESDNNDPIYIVPTENFNAQAEKWISRDSQYYSYINNLLCMLITFDLRGEAEALYQALAEIEAEYQNKIGEKIYNLWSDTINPALPDYNLNKEQESFSAYDKLLDLEPWGMKFVKNLIPGSTHIEWDNRSNKLFFALKNGYEIFDDVVQQIEIFLRNELKIEAYLLFKFIEDEVIKNADESIKDNVEKSLWSSL